MSDVSKMIAEEAERFWERRWIEANRRIKALEAALRAIMKATVEGRVCDDVAWFDSITTLHDFCDITLNGPE